MTRTQSPAYQWEFVDTGHSTHFRGLAVVDREIVWLAGYDGVILRTIDGGRNWDNVSPQGAEQLQFRAIAAFDTHAALAMTAGIGADSRIYRTEDGGNTWLEVMRGTEPDSYFNSLRFSDRSNGLLLGDPIDGRFLVLRTTDGGRNWHKVVADSMPQALPGEGAFAASGGCLAVRNNSAWFGTGGAERARVFGSVDHGQTWTVSETVMGSREMAGIFGLTFTGEGRGFAVGGNYLNPGLPHMTTMMTTESGNTKWEATGGPVSRGFRSAVAVFPRRPNTVVTVGMGGSDISYDHGAQWLPLNEGFDSVECAEDGSCWASGENGRVAILAS